MLLIWILSCNGSSDAFIFYCRRVCELTLQKVYLGWLVSGMANQEHNHGDCRNAFQMFNLSKNLSSDHFCCTSTRTQPFESYLLYNLSFYCVNTSYSVDNCYTGRCNRSSQTTEKAILCKNTSRIGLVMCICYVVHRTPCLDSVMSWHLFHLARVVCGRVFEELLKFEEK